MGVIEHGKPVWFERERFVQSFGESHGRLVGEAVNQINIDRLKTELPHPFHRLRGHCKWLDAMDRLLDHWLVVLHAHGGAVKSNLPERLQVTPGKPARIDFHSRFDIRRKLES